MRRPLRHWGMREAVLLHHPSDPSAAGMSRSLARAKGTLQSRSRQRSARSWHVRTGTTLACRSSRRGAWMAASIQPALVYFPSLFDIGGVWEALSGEECRLIAKLRQSCQLGKASLLAFQLNISVFFAPKKIQQASRCAACTAGQRRALLRRIYFSAALARQSLCSRWRCPLTGAGVVRVLWRSKNARRPGSVVCRACGRRRG